MKANHLSLSFLTPAFFVLILGTVLCSTNDNIDPEYNFDKFMSQFGKNYTGD